MSLDSNCTGCGIPGEFNQPCPQCQRPVRCGECRGTGVVLVSVRLGESAPTKREYAIMGKLRSQLVPQ